MPDPDHVALADQFFTAIEQGDLDRVRATLAADAVTCTNFGGESTVEQTMKVLGWLQRKATNLRYDVLRREPIEGGFLQEHVLRATAPDGSDVAMPACIVASVADGKITRINEYLDPTHVEALSRNA